MTTFANLPYELQYMILKDVLPLEPCRIKHADLYNQFRLQSTNDELATQPHEEFRDRATNLVLALPILKDVVIDICVKRLAERRAECHELVTACEAEDEERAVIADKMCDCYWLSDADSDDDSDWECNMYAEDSGDDDDEHDYEYFPDRRGQTKQTCKWCWSGKMKRLRAASVAGYPLESFDELRDLIKILKKAELS